MLHNSIIRVLNESCYIICPNYKLSWLNNLYCVTHFIYGSYMYVLISQTRLLIMSHLCLSLWCYIPILKQTQLDTFTSPPLVFVL